MAAKPVVFHPRATDEYESAVQWYLERGPWIGARFAQEISEAIVDIASAPQRWTGVFPGTRRFLLHAFPFAVVYRELLDRIEVLAVAHDRRRPAYWKDRL